jgi:hypothetical protein
LNPIVPLSKGSAAQGQIARLLANSGDSDLAQVGSDLGDLHSRRIDADYELNNLGAENPSTVHATVVEAAKMIGTLDDAFTGAGSLALKRAIQTYWTAVLREPLRGKPKIP